MGEGVGVADAVTVGVTPGGRVGLGVSVGGWEAGLAAQATRLIAKIPANNCCLNITILIIEKRSGVNACDSEDGMINFDGNNAQERAFFLCIVCVLYFGISIRTSFA